MITWVVNGTQTTQVYEKGKTPTFPGTPEKPETARYRYVFAGWDQEIVPVTSDATYTAQFTQVGGKRSVRRGSGYLLDRQRRECCIPRADPASMSAARHSRIITITTLAKDGKAVKDGNYKGWARITTCHCRLTSIALMPMASSFMTTIHPKTAFARVMDRSTTMLTA